MALAAAVVAAAVLRPPGRSSTATGGDYLALGDSIAFGYLPPDATTPPDYRRPATLTSYVDDVAEARHYRVTNPSCPGETTGSMLAVDAVSNGCENSLGRPGGYRTAWPLHVEYRGSQQAFAVRFLRSHPATRLVTLTIGANDAFVCEQITADHCAGAAERAAVVSEVDQGVGRILAGLRSDGRYRGPLLVVSDAAPDYSEPEMVAWAPSIDAAIARAAERNGALVADGLRAFAVAAGPVDGPCRAGLLARRTRGGCDIHPSAAGHAVLARAAEAALDAGHP
ncbi:MAG TPA: SGNH/GDSL hydrolase family protein [Acidimicrobiales bacterium]|nr:SGNH/GDSL hydrolase family protein [Acidimicrobiales bacterium]